MKRIIQLLPIIVALITVLVPLQSFALTSSQRSEIEKRPFYDKTDCAPSSTPVDTGDGPLVGSNNPEKAFNYLKGKGLNDAQAAGIVGNMQVESSPDVDPTATNPNGATGIIQWKDGRKDALFAFAEQNNADPLTLELQLKFFWYEMNQAGTYENSQWQRFRAETDSLTGVEGAATAAAAFDRYIERCNCATTERQNNARNIFNTYAGGAASPTPSDSDPDTNQAACVAGASLGGGVGGLDIFPMQNITKTILQGGADGVPGNGDEWCYDNTTNCHGVYKAADIHAPEGTVNIAAKGGRVVGRTDQVGSVGSSLTILGEDGQYVYYYTHMAYGSLRFNDGDTVNAGDPIGVVGNSNQAAGTAPHLHIDMLPGSFGNRPSCRRTSCPDNVRNSFIDVQTPLNQLYQGLPN